MISALYFSPMLWNSATAASRSMTRRVTLRSAAAISFIFASIFSRSSGVNGRSNAKS